MIWWIRKLLLIYRAFSSQKTPRQLALGVACGLVLGLVPKGNLLFAVIASVLLVLRTNLAVTALTALVVGILAPLCDPIMHHLGQAVLTYPMLVPVWRWLYRQPLAAWTSMNNTVVMGSFLMSMMLFFPVYRLSLLIVVRARLWKDSRQPCELPSDCPQAELSTAEEPDLSETISLLDLSNRRHDSVDVTFRRVNTSHRKSA